MLLFGPLWVFCGSFVGPLWSFAVFSHTGQIGFVGLLWVLCWSFVVLCGPLRYLVIPVK